MRIATWNVERPKNATSPRSRRLLAKLQEVDADIWILTETNDAISPGPDYCHLATEQVTEAPTRHAPGERRTIVWSRWPIVQVIEEDLRHRTACVRLDTPIGGLVVFGTIIPYSGRDCPPYGQLRRWDAHYAAIGVQGAAWQRLRRQHPDCVLCVAGDFNQTREGRLTYGTKWGRHLLDQALAWADLQDTTIPGFAAGEAVNSEGWLLPEDQQPIDHICLSRTWAGRVTTVGAWSGRADSGYLSDHSGVWIELE